MLVLWTNVALALERLTVSLEFVVRINDTFKKNFQNISRKAGHDVNFCSNLPRRASEIQFSLALLQLSLALENLYV